MTHFKAKMHRIRFLVSVRLSFRSFGRLCLRWSLTLSSSMQLAADSDDGLYQKVLIVERLVLKKFMIFLLG